MEEIPSCVAILPFLLPLNLSSWNAYATTVIYEFINLNIAYTAYYELARFIRRLQKQHVWSSTSHNSLYHSTFIPLRWLSVAACVRFKSLMLPYQVATCTATTYFKSITQVYESSRSLQFAKELVPLQISIQTLMCCPLLVVSPNLIQSQNPFMSSKNHLKCSSESTLSHNMIFLSLSFPCFLSQKKRKK